MSRYLITFLYLMSATRIQGTNSLMKHHRYVISPEPFNIQVGMQFNGHSKISCAAICNSDNACLGFSKEQLDMIKACKLVYSFEVAASGGELCYIQDGVIISYGGNGTSWPITSASSTEVPNPTSSNVEIATSSNDLTVLSSLSSTTITALLSTSSSASASTTLPSTSASAFSSSTSNTTTSYATTINYQTKLSFVPSNPSKITNCLVTQVLVGFGLPAALNGVTDLICLTLSQSAYVVDQSRLASSATVPCSQLTPGLLAFANGINTQAGYLRKCYPMLNGWAVENYTVNANLTSSVSSYPISGAASGNSHSWAICPVSSVVWTLDNILANGALVVTSIQCVKIG